MGSFFALGRSLDRAYPFKRQYGARFALNILAAINLLNFADRYVVSSVKQLIEDDLHLTDFETALPVTGMIVVFMIFAVIFGVLSDRNVMDRRVMLCGAIVFWSLATAAAGFSRNLTQLIVFRSLVGVGEAAYGTIAPPLISDYYPQHERNVAYGIYYLAIPIGGALGFGIGSLLGSLFGWRVAFFGCGLPGVLAAISVLRICNPVRGINDPPTLDSNGAPASPPVTALSSLQESKVSSEMRSNIQNNNTHSEGGKQLTSYQQFSIFMADMWEIVQNPHFMLATLGQAANNFALGGLADWYETYMLRYSNISLSFAGLSVGAVTVIGGLGGTILGSKVADHYKTRVKSSYFLIPAIFTLPAAGLLMLAINFPQPVYLNLAFIMVGEIMVWTNTAPINSITVTVVPPRLRSRASGLCIFIQHMLGDIISPPIIGAISDATGSLKTALQITWMVVIVSGIFWWAGYYFFPPLDITLDGEDTDALISRVDGGGVKEDSFEAGGFTGGAVVLPPPTYSGLLCGSDPLVENDVGQIVERDTKETLVARSTGSGFGGNKDIINPVHNDDNTIFS